MSVVRSPLSTNDLLQMLHVKTTFMSVKCASFGERQKTHITDVRSHSTVNTFVCSQIIATGKWFITNVTSKQFDTRVDMFVFAKWAWTREYM